MNTRLPIALAVMCAVIAAVLKLALNHYPEYDLMALLAADVIMFLLSVAAWAMLRGAVAERPQAFVRGVYGATMLRLFVCLTAILVYAVMNRQHLHKATLFLMFGIYIAYTIVETAFVSRTAKNLK